MSQALDLDPDYLTHLNFAVTLVNNDEPERAREHFNSFKNLFEVCMTHKSNAQSSPPNRNLVGVVGLLELPQQI